MNPTTLSNGEQLRIGILEYADEIIPKFWLRALLCFSTPIITISLMYITGIEISYALFWLFLSIIIGGSGLFFIFGQDYETAGIHYYKQLSNLMQGSIGYFGIDNESKYIIIEFFTPSRLLIHKNENTKPLVEHIFYILMPQFSRKEFSMYVQFYAMPSLDFQPENSIMDELEKVVDGELNRNSSNLPIDIKDKGKEMSRAYLMLYCIENTLRLYIEAVEKNMTNPLFISNSVRKKISDRKANEAQNKYLSIRGNSDLFYLDFKELGDIIVNNQDLLRHFPSDNWVKVKIEELGNIRNLIAHNSYIGELEIRIITANYESILRQIRK